MSELRGTNSNRSELLVPLSHLSPKVVVYPFYFNQQIPGTSNESFLRQGAAKRLLEAADRLPDKLQLVILDAWRSYETQLAIYNQTIKMFKQKGYSPEKLKEELSKYVAFPSKDLDSLSPHLTGGAVDVTLADKNGWLNMGTDFDEFHEKAQSDWYESKPLLTPKEQIIRENRRLLKLLMESAGFTGNEHEWWHFDFGNRSWANITNSSPIYFYIERPS